MACLGLTLWACGDARHGDDPPPTRDDAAMQPPPSGGGGGGTEHDAGTRDATVREDPTTQKLIELGADPLAPLLHGEAQRAALCARDHDDLLHDLACEGALLQAQGLSELYALLDLDPSSKRPDEGVTLSGHTTALSIRSVSAINPRAIIVRRPQGEAQRELLMLSFTRGEQAVELAVRDRTTDELRFYLLSYGQACNDDEGGCLPGELLTAETERGWRNLQLYDHGDLSNTVLDCGTCHQPDGPTTPPILRMVETTVPFTHWFWRHGRGGQALLADYEAAHGQAPYAGIPWTEIYDSEPGELASYLRLEGFAEQPTFFDSPRIEQEVSTSAPDQPWDNSTMGQSATWRQGYDRVSAAGAPPMPHHDVKITDPDKLAAVSEAYARHARGELALEALPDLRDVLPDDDARLSHTGLRPDPALQGEALLRAACGRCHGGQLDPDVSRARFDIDALTEESRMRAVDRLGRPPSAPGAMPPPRLLTLSEAQRAALIALLDAQ